MKRLEGDGTILGVAFINDKSAHMDWFTGVWKKRIENGVIEWLEIQRGLLVNFSVYEIELLDRLLGKMLNQVE
ncbi:hypothetical protein [Shewanella polaris]|uniref:Uncharacterized protein n=1 Tax=Shewanella polaris TaxID=2588449 RepID=A0A4Y5YEE9_9GAMM|nr:hypothetical protein [Shewanella polaris]QDE30896.1 hypothetical protein FH971_07925 [Shewanella polaris]